MAQTLLSVPFVFCGYTRRVKFLRLVSLVLSVSLGIYAQSGTQIVSGQAIAADGAPFSGVTVLIENSGTGVSQVTTTNSLGFFQFKPIPPAGGYQITVLKEGMDVGKATDIVVRPNQDTPVPTIRSDKLNIDAVDANKTVRGTVIDPDGKPIPTAIVVLSNPGMIGTKQAITVSNGSFTFGRVRSAERYAVSFLVNGMSAGSIENISTASQDTVELPAFVSWRTSTDLSATARAKFSRKGWNVWRISVRDTQGYSADGAVRVVSRKGGEAVASCFLVEGSCELYVPPKKGFTARVYSKGSVAGEIELASKGGAAVVVAQDVPVTNRWGSIVFGRVDARSTLPPNAFISLRSEAADYFEMMPLGEDGRFDFKMLSSADDYIVMLIADGSEVARSPRLSVAENSRVKADLAVRPSTAP